MLRFKTHAEPNDSNSVDHGELFYSIIKLNKLKTIVEVGVDMGSTTRYLCQAAREVGGFVYGYDNWGDYGPNNSWHHPSNKEEVESLLRNNNFDNFNLYKVNTLSGDFKKLIDKHHTSIDFAFIDAEHSYDGIKNDFLVVYPKLSVHGIIAFHDTLRIDGCREFIIDLRTKYNDGTFDVVDFPFGNQDRRAGVSLLVKRSYPLINIGIDEICGSISSPDKIYEKEIRWLEAQMISSNNETK